MNTIHRMRLKGIDNVFFEVINLNRAIAFYQDLGFKQKLVIPQINAVLFAIGNEVPGLILCEKHSIAPAKMWIEVPDASRLKDHCSLMGIQGKQIETATGVTFEIVDESGNIIGFADYSKKPELARCNDQEIVKGIAESYAKRIWDDKDLTAIDELLHEKCVIHSLLEDFHGQEFMKKVVQTWLTRFPDLMVTNTSVISEKDLVAIHWQAKGYHLGEFKGIKPTGKHILNEG